MPDSLTEFQPIVEPTGADPHAVHAHPLPDAAEVAAAAVPGRRFNAAYVVETGWLAGGFVTKFLIQIGTLYYLTSGLGKDGVGTFFAVMGLLACLAPFITLGNYDLTIRDIARGEDPQAVAGRAMRSTLAAFLLFVPVLVLLRLVLSQDVGWTAFLAIAAGELLSMRVVNNVQAVATGFRMHYVVAVCDFLLGLARFVTMFVAAKLHAGVDTTLMLYALTSVPAAIVSYGWMIRRVGWPHWRGGPMLPDFRDHGRMLMASFADMAAGQGDKPILKSLASAGDVGIWGTACKLYITVVVPIDLLTQVCRPRVSTAYGESPARGKHFSRVMTLGLVALGVLCGLGLFAAVWAIPFVMPGLIKSEFADARYALMFLALVPPVYALQRANVISAIARGATGVYASSITIAAACGLAVLVAGAPRFGWRAACAAYFTYQLASCAVAFWAGRETKTVEQPAAALRPA